MQSRGSILPVTQAVHNKTRFFFSVVRRELLQICTKFYCTKNTQYGLIFHKLIINRSCDVNGASEDERIEGFSH